VWLKLFKTAPAVCAKSIQIIPRWYSEEEVVPVTPVSGNRARARTSLRKVSPGAATRLDMDDGDDEQGQLARWDELAKAAYDAQDTGAVFSLYKKAATMAQTSNKTLLLEQEKSKAACCKTKKEHKDKLRVATKDMWSQDEVDTMLAEEKQQWDTIESKKRNRTGDDGKGGKRGKTEVVDEPYQMKLISELLTGVSKCLHAPAAAPALDVNALVLALASRPSRD
jgi:hypothetical protein